MSANQVKAGENYVELKARDGGVVPQTRAIGEKMAQEAERQAKRARAQAEREEATRARRAVSMRQQMLTQAAFGVEDAASQYQTMGAGGAIRAASNNVSAMLMATGSLGVAMGGIAAIAAFQVAPSIIEMFTQSTKKARELEDAVRGIGEQFGTLQQLQTIEIGSAQEIERIGGLKTSAEAESTAQGKGNDLQKLEAQRALLDRQLNEIKSLQQQEMTRFIDSQQGAGGQFLAEAESWFKGDQHAARTKTLAQEHLSIEQKREILLAQIAAREAEAAAAKQRQLELAKREAEMHQASLRNLDSRAQLAGVEGMEDVGRIDTFQAGATALQQITREIRRLDVERGAIETDAQFADTPQARREIETRRRDNQLRRQNAEDQRQALNDKLPELARKNSRERTAKLFEGLVQSTGTEAAKQAAVDVQHRSTRDQIDQLPLPSSTRERLQRFNDANASLATSRLELQKAARESAPSIPKEALQRGSVAAVQAANANKNASETTRMANAVEEMEDRIDDMADDLREFLNQHGRI